MSHNYYWSLPLASVSDGLVIGSNASESLKLVANAAKAIYGDRIQVCQIGALNNQVEFNAMATAVVAAGGHTCKYLGGPFYCNGFVDPKDNLIHDFGGNTVYFANQSNIGIVAGNVPGTGVPARSGFAIKNAILDGQQTALDTNTTALLAFADCTDYLLEHLRVLNSRSYGAILSGPNNARCRIYDYYASGCQRGGLEYSEGSGLDADFLRIIDCDLEGAQPQINFEAGNRSITGIRLSHVLSRHTDFTSNRRCFGWDGDTQNATGLILSQFRFEGGVYGISMVGSGLAKISDGQIIGPTNGIRLSATRAVVDTDIHDVDIIDCQTRGLWLGAPAAPGLAGDNWHFKGLNIYGKTVVPTLGIYVDPAPQDNITNCFLDDSHIHGNATNITNPTAVITQHNVTVW